MTPTTSDAQRIAQVVQAMAKDAGFDIKIQSTEFATSLKLSDKGQYEAYVLAWSGRADPDGNLHTFLACKGPLNNAGYCKPEVDDAIEKARISARPGAARQALRDRRQPRRQGPADHLPLPPPLAVGAQRQAHRPAHRARRDGARAGPEDELTS